MGAPLAAPSSDGGSEKHYCPVLVVRNRTRQALEMKRIRALSNKVKSECELPMVLFAHMRTLKRTKQLSCDERAYLRTLPDNEFDKAPPFVFLYPGAWLLITANVNVKCGLAQGTRGQQVGWPEFPNGTTFSTVTVNGIRVRKPSQDPVCVLFFVTSAHMRHIPEGQPQGLPSNVVALPMWRHKKCRVNLSQFHGATRKSVSIQMTQIPLRPANVITSYTAQSASFERLVIFETSPRELYTQISRCSRGIDSISFALPLGTKFKPSKRENTLKEIERLETLHRLTEHEHFQEMQHSIPGIDSMEIEGADTSVRSAQKAQCAGSAVSRSRLGKKDSDNESDENEDLTDDSYSDSEEATNSVSESDNEDESKSESNSENESGEDIEKKIPHTPKYLPKPIVNMGNTCFFSSVIQMLASSNILVHSLKPGQMSPHWLDRLFTFLMNFRKSGLQISKNDITDVYTTLPRPFSCNTQEDASDFLLHILTKCEEQAEQRRRTMLPLGYSSSITTCSTCNCISERTEPFNIMTLSLPTQLRTEPIISLEVLLLNETNETLNDPENFFDCENCRPQKQPATREVQITLYPVYLFISLSRFSYDSTRLQTQKKLTRVSTPQNMHLGPYSYELLAVIFHIGESPNEGHYFSLIRDDSGSFENHMAPQWFFANDDVIKIATERDLTDFETDSLENEAKEAVTPYILLYRQRRP